MRVPRGRSERMKNLVGNRCLALVIVTKESAKLSGALQPLFRVGVREKD